MIERIGEAPPRTMARIAGILCLLGTLTSLLGDSLADRARVVPGNAAAAAASIIAHEPLLRLGVAANLFAIACHAVVTVAWPRARWSATRVAGSMRRPACRQPGPEMTRT